MNYILEKTYYLFRQQVKTIILPVISLKASTYLDLAAGYDA